MPTKQQLENLLREPEFRRQFVADYVQEMVAAQIRAIREHRGWTQPELGEAADGMKQAQISRLENPDYSGATMNSLKRVAQAFDLGLIVRMAPFSEFVDWIAGMSPERLAPPSYSEEREQFQKQHERELLLGLANASFALSTSSTHVPFQGGAATVSSSDRPNHMTHGEWLEEQALRDIQAPRQPETTQGEREFAIAA